MNELNNKFMPSKDSTKSLDNVNLKIAEYELMANCILQKIRKILRVSFSEALLIDYEFAIAALTMLKMGILPKEIKTLSYLYKRYNAFEAKNDQ